MRAARLAQGGRPTIGAQPRPRPTPQQRPTRPRVVPIAAPAYREQMAELERLSFRFDQTENAEMWRDYRIFKAAGLFKAWREKWVGRVPARYLQPPPRPAL